jgi:acyl-homoserine-lactone acylase
MLLIVLSLIGCTGKSPVPQDTDTSSSEGVTLRRTAHGVVHVTAADVEGLAFGVGYAYTQDNRCLLAHRIAEVNGRLAAQLGARGDVELPVHGVSYPALDSDRFYRGWLDDAALEAAFAAGSADARAMAEGYAAGINRYIADNPGLPACEVEFTEDVSVPSVYRLWVATAGVASGEVLAPYLASSAPAAAAGPPAPPAPPPSAGGPTALRRLASAPFGSNAWALGRDATREGEAVHLYNPHFPWSGIHRIYMVHLTIPGELDVMGGTLGGLPVPLVGFNRHVAWGLTFSTAARFTVAELALVSGDPQTYTVDGETRAITEELLSIDVRGEETPREVSFFRSEDGPILDATAFRMGWTASSAFAIHDVNEENTRIVEQFLGISRATSVAEVQASLEMTQGVPWSYTLAADDAGDVFFGDISNVPAVSAEMLDTCSTSSVAEALRAYGIYVLDGSRAECAWSGRMAAPDLPSITRSDYVANSNNTYDLPNVDAPLLGYSPILGVEGGPLALRPSLGLAMIEERLAGTDGLGDPGFTGSLAGEVFHQERNRAGELLADAVADACLEDPVGTWAGDEVDLSEVCAALAGWDQRNTVDSVGALVFAGLWTSMEDTGDAEDLFETPASWEDPVGTPTGFSTDPAVRADAKEALARVALALAEAGISPDAAWGDGHAVDAPAGRYPLPGGPGGQGIFDVIENAEGYGTWNGWTASLTGMAPEALFGASYEHVVTLGVDGPAAEGLLAYGQATETSSPWYLDQLDTLSSSTWFAFPFTEDAILADPELETLSF